MKTARPFELKERIYQLCNKEQYFNAGSNEQYSMMFYAATSEQFSTRDVAVMIGICSVCANISKVQEQIEAILTDIEEAEALCRGDEQQAAGERAADEVYCGYFD